MFSGMTSFLNWFVIIYRRSIWWISWSWNYRGSSGRHLGFENTRPLPGHAVNHNKLKISWHYPDTSDLFWKTALSTQGRVAANASIFWLFDCPADRFPRNYHGDQWSNSGRHQFSGDWWNITRFAYWGLPVNNLEEFHHRAALLYTMSACLWVHC
jgi:hypothetical protein